MDIAQLYHCRPSQRGQMLRVLVCSIGAEFPEILESDKRVYMRFYQSVDAVSFLRIKDLFAAIDQGYDIVHLLCSTVADGRIADCDRAVILGSDLVTKCSNCGVKLLWIASDNKANDYITGFKILGNRINLIMTISRNGASFSSFLVKVLSKISSGTTLPKAWVSLVPQANGEWQKDFPSSIFCAGAAEAQFLP